MFHTYLKVKVWRPWMRAHLCTLALAFSLNSTWRIPRDAFHYGGLAYGLLITVALVTVALPAALLQLSVGQLSQQDPVGVWRAVPLFKGIGYARLLISYTAAICVIVYLAMSAIFFLYTLNNSIPFWECTELVENTGQESEIINSNATSCFNETFFAPIYEKPEYYIALALVVVFLWVLFPFVLYRSFKTMKFIFYILGPTIPLLWIIITGSIGDKAGLPWFSKTEDWVNFLKPEMWNKAIAQALIAAQVAGGFLISSGDTVYASSDVEWTTLIFIGTNIISVWFGIIIWFTFGNAENDNSVFAVLVRTYNFAIEKNLRTVWPLLIFATLFLSGCISMISLLYPLYDRFRRIGGQKWQYIAIVSSLLGAGLAIVAMLDHSALFLLEDTIIPFLVNFITIVEISAFIFIYGWKVLLHDVEFLIGRDLMRFWVWGLCATPGIIGPFLVWWYTTRFSKELQWTQPPWVSSGLAGATAIVIILFIVFGIYSITRQVHYDVIAKFKSTLRPSRHWGPRDPIAHYYWLMRRDEMDPHAPRSRYHRRNLGQFSGTSSVLSVSKSQEVNDDPPLEIKRRSNSDDWLYNYRKEYLAEVFHIYYPERKRPKSLDGPILKARGINDKRQSENSCSTNNDSVIVVDNKDGTDLKS